MTMQPQRSEEDPPSSWEERPSQVLYENTGIQTKKYNP